MEHLDVLIVGAGLSGIGAAHHVVTDTPWASYAVFEARDSLGGTWDLFRYPGVRSDSDMHTLGYGFRPWSGEKSIADGASILQYLKDTAADAGIDRHIRYHHRVERLDWSTPDACWYVTARNTETDETVELTCSFVVSCTGYYRYDHGYLPDWEGFDDYRGQIVHPQHWPEDLDYTGKKVIVIGSGATAVTVVPSMAPKAAHVTMLQRSPTYMATVPTVNPLAKGVRKVLPPKAAGSTLKWINAVGTQGLYHLSKRRPDLVRKMLRKGLERQLPKGYDIDTHFSPRYDPWDERLCAVTDGDLFRCIREGSVDVVTDTIERFTETGVRLSSGRELTADIIVPATGLELLFIGGMELTVDGEKVDVAERFVYKGMMLEQVPNMAVVVGYTNASWTLKADLTSEYVTKLLDAMRTRRLRQCTPTNDDGSVEPQPLLGLSSGYITRSADRFPKQGSRFPWQVYQSYLRDYRAMKLSPIDDEAMVFSNPGRFTGRTGGDTPGAKAPALAGTATTQEQ